MIGQKELKNIQYYRNMPLEDSQTNKLLIGEDYCYQKVIEDQQHAILKFQER